MFGLFSKSAKPRPVTRVPDQIGCFGKMPIHPDFIRHNINTREGVALEKWLQEGIGLVTRKHPGGWPEVYKSFPRFNFVLIGGEQERTLAGTLTASQDKSGRHYPFATMVAAEEPLFRQMQAIVPWVFRDFFRDTEDISRASWSNEPLSLLTGRVDGICRRDTGLSRRQLLEGEIAELEAIPMGRFWSQTLPEADAGAREQLFNTLFSALKTVLRRGPTRTNWGIRLPIPAQGDQTPFVMFWLQIVESILEDRTWRAHCFWSRAAADQPASLTIFFKPLPGSFLLQLLNPAVDDGSIFDITREMASQGEVSNSPDLKRLLANNDSTMLQVLYKAGRREALP